MVKEILEKEESCLDGSKIQCHMGSVHEETKVEDVDLTKEDTFVWAKLAGRQPNKIRG